MAVVTRGSERSGLGGGQIAVIVSALLLLLGFFLPWANTGAGSPSGLGIAQNPAALQSLGLDKFVLGALLYLVPLMALVALGVSFVRQAFTGPIIAGATLLAFIVLAYYLVLLNRAPTVAAEVAGGGTPIGYIGLGIWAALIGVFGALGGSFNLLRRYMPTGSALTSRRIATAGMLGAIAVALGVTRLGFIPVPNVSGFATIMHLPAIIGAVLEGPVVGVVAGGIFGIFSLLQDTTGLFSNPLVSVVPRLFIGFTAWLTYRSLARFNTDVAAVVAGIVGTLTNTILVVGTLVLLGLIPATAVPTIMPQAIAEVVIAAILTPIVVRAVNLTRSGRTSADDTTPREKSYF